jgi:hypothetical protein
MCTCMTKYFFGYLGYADYLGSNFLGNNYFTELRTPKKLQVLLANVAMYITVISL